MQGIFLHILADALGSVAVIISTLLTKSTAWSGWDPIASCIIAILIFFSAIPLVKSSGKRLLLSLSGEAEYECRGTLQGISELRGVVGYAGVRFWVNDQETDTHSHDHHGHSHSHSQVHGEHHHHDSHSHSRLHGSSCPPPIKLLGVIHIIASPTADINDVRGRVTEFLTSKGVDMVVHVEREGETYCWCGGGATFSPR